MSDYASARAALIAAVDELDTWQGQPTLSSQLGTLNSQGATITQLQADKAQLTADLATRTQERDARQQAIVDVRARAQARKDADAAKVEGQDDLDALSGF